MKKGLKKRERGKLGRVVRMARTRPLLNNPDSPERRVLKCAFKLRRLLVDRSVGEDRRFQIVMRELRALRKGDEIELVICPMDTDLRNV